MPMLSAMSLEGRGLSTKTRNTFCFEHADDLKFNFRGTF